MMKSQNASYGQHLLCFEVEQSCSVTSQTEEGAFSLLIIFDILCSPHRYSPTKTVRPSTSGDEQRIYCGSMCVMNVETELSRLSSGYEEFHCEILLNNLH